MAYAIPRRGSKLLTVYYYDSKLGKTVPLSRKDTPPEIDGMTKEQADEWLERVWEPRHGRQVHRARKHVVAASDELADLWEAFQRYWQDIREISDGQVATRQEDFERYVVPYFVTLHGQKNVRRWHELTHQFPVWLSTKTGLRNAENRKKVVGMVLRFGQYLVSVEILTYPWVIIKPTQNKRRKTPLTTRLAPATVLRVACEFVAAEQPNYAIAVLLGYFASLGPAEVCGVEVEDFLVREQAVAESPTYDGLKRHEERWKDHRLGSRLAVFVRRQVVKGKVAKFPKNDYRHAVVNIWYPEAAVLLGQLLTGRRGRLFTLSRSRLNALHRTVIKPKLGATAHDLRRASALYLGRTVQIPLELLQRHLRHSQLSTTALYIREPEQPDIVPVTHLTFDDVG